MPKDQDVGSAETVMDTPTPTQASLPAARDSSPSMVPASVIADRYEILGLLGMGGMGRVYRAHDRTLDEIVALKILRRELVDVPGVLDRFRQEVKLARRVTSPHVVRTFDLGQYGDEHFLTMEYIDGHSLAQVIDDAPMAVDEVVKIARAMCAGIAAAHAQGVLHRDLKPDNVLVAKDGRIAISDFGIARISASPRQTVDRFVGTPAYMAPEQVEGKDEITTAVDVYAIGAILFEMLAGRRPFVGDDVFAVALARLREPPPDPRTFRPVPDRLAELVGRCLAREPAARFPDATAVERALGALGDLTIAVHPSRFAINVPARTSRSVALLPLRASGDLAEIADGLSEEIVDALSMTRALRVRPLASVRGAAREGADSREVGQSLGVDVIVDGSVRRRGEAVRISARVIGVADGFQLWANHFDTGSDKLLAAGDDVVRAIARALTVELDMPERADVDPHVTELYLEAKAKLRAGWVIGGVESVIATLDVALPLAPQHPGVLATLAMANARSAFYSGVGTLERARQLAERAVALAPSSGEAQLALGVACMYAGDMPLAARSLFVALQIAPGLAMAQSLLGAMAVDAGLVDVGIAHLEAAMSLDPFVGYIGDLARAYVYAGRESDAFRILGQMPNVYGQISIARFKMWGGELYDAEPTFLEPAVEEFTKYRDIVFRLHRTGVLSREDRELMKQLVLVPSRRLRATRTQFLAEFLMFVGDHDDALAHIELSVQSGLQDYVWMQRCPLLAPLRDHPTFKALEAIVGARARDVITAVEDAATKRLT